VNFHLAAGQFHFIVRSEAAILQHENDTRLAYFIHAIKSKRWYAYYCSQALWSFCASTNSETNYGYFLK
jgi:hypothetical protein